MRARRNGLGRILSEVPWCSSWSGMLDVMSDLAATAKPVGIVAKMARRVGVALTISIGVALLVLILWNSPSALFFRTITLGLAATTVFSLFDV